MKRLNRKEFSDYKIANIDFIERKDIKISSADNSSYYEMPNGNILMILLDGKRGIIYDSENELKQWVADIMNQGPKHILSGYFLTMKMF